MNCQNISASTLSAMHAAARVENERMQSVLRGGAPIGVKRFRTRIMDVMSDRRERTSNEICRLVGADNEKQRRNTRDTLLRMFDKGLLESEIVFDEYTIWRLK